MENKIIHVKKRDNTVVDFDQSRIEEAIFKALTAADQGDGEKSKKLSQQVIQLLNRRFKKGDIPHVEQIQDIVEEVLIMEGLVETARAYILYREQRRRIREATLLFDESTEAVDRYIQELDWQVNENANMAYSLQGLNQYTISAVAKKYWLNKIYPKEIREAAFNEDFHIHNLDTIAPYCEGWDLYDLLLRGFGGVPSKIESRPAKHLRTALGQLVNFLFTLQGESAGANAVSNLDTLLAPFIRYDNLNYPQVKQAMQEFLYNCMVPTRVGFQSLCWDELVVVKDKGKIKFEEIGKLVDAIFDKSSHRIIEKNPSSYAIENYDDYYALSFDDRGKAVWSKIKAFVRHRVPQNSEFVKIKTGRGEARVSKAHSLFSFSEFNGKFNPEPKSAEDIKLAKNYQELNSKNHFIALKSFENQGKKTELDLVEVLDEIPQLHKNIFVKINPTHTLEKIRQNIILEKQSFVPFYKEFGLKDRGVWRDWLEKKSIRYEIWRKYGDLTKIFDFKLKNSDAFYPRILKGELLENFVKLCAWYITEGHTAISTPLYISQSPSKNSKEIIAILKELNALGQIAENKSYSQKKKISGKVFKITGKGLLAEIISRSCGYLSFNKVIPPFIFELSPKYQKIFFETLLKGDVSEYKTHWDFDTTSKKLSLSLSLLLAQNNYRFNVYGEATSKINKKWHDKWKIRIYKENSVPRKSYFVNDFEARSCLRIEKFRYTKEYEYDISVDLPQENFIGGSGLLVFHNTPFLNVSLDIKVPSFYKDQPVIIGGQPQKESYGDFQEEMNMFTRAFYECMMEGDAKGRPFSVDSDCLCPIKNSGQLKLVKIGEYIDDLMEKRRPIFIKENNCQVLDVRDLNIKCLGLKGGKIDWQEVNLLVRHPLDFLLKISVAGGFSIKTSHSHSVLVLKDGKIESFEASKLKPGDYLITPKIIPLGENKISNLSLVEEFIKKGQERGIYISNVFKGNVLYQETRIKPCNNRSYQVSTFPLGNITDKLNNLNLGQAKLSLAGSNIKIPNYLPITKELVEFLGWYCAEGSAEKNSKYGGISLGLNLKKEKEQAQYISQLIQIIFGKIPVYLRKVKERNLIEVRVHSKLVRRIVTEVLGIQNSEKRKIPQIIFELSPEMKKIFLFAYFKGDAWITRDIMANSISRELIYGISTILKQLGVFHTLTEYQWKGKPRWRVNIWQNKELETKDSYTISKIPVKESGLEEIVEKILEKEPYFYDSLGRKYKNSKSRILQKFGIFCQASASLKKVEKVIKFAQRLEIETPSVLKEIEKNNLSFLKIKKIEKVSSSNGMVYDFSTESENFIANQLLVHNTFPIPTVSITKDFDWESQALDPLWEATAKYGVNYFSNFIQSDMSPDDVRSMCLDAAEEILIRNQDGIKRLAIKDVAENYKESGFDEDGWAEGKKEKGLEVLSLNPDTLKLEWTAVKRFLRIKDKEEIRIISDDGKVATFSVKHPLAVYTPAGIKMKFAKDIQRDDYLLSLKRAGDGILSEEYQSIDDLRLDEDLAKILGYFIADGNFLFKTKRIENNNLGPEPRGFQFTFKTGDKENIQAIKTLVKKVFNLDCKEKQDPRYNSFYLYIYNSELAKKIYNAGFIKYGRLPQLLFDSPSSVIKDFLEFHFKGDGCEKRKEIHINDIDLSRDLVLLYSLIGKPVTYKLRKKSQRIYLQHGESTVKAGNGWLNTPILAERVPGWLAFSIYRVPGLVKSRTVGLKTLDKYNAQTKESLRIEKSDIYLTRVRDFNIKKYQKAREFYDIELEKNHLFVHSLGQISFNCCRLRLDKRELYKRGGGLFGSDPSTGSIGVITINMPRIGYLSKTKKEFFERLGHLMELAKESLEIKRKALENFMEKGLYPYSRHYLEGVKKIRGAYFSNHFSTIGLLGMNEALLNFLGENIATKRGRAFTLEVLDFMRERLLKYQEETGDLYNLEATPAEGTSYRQAKADKEKYPKIITAGTKETPYYTNSTMLPVNFTDDVFSALKLQDEIQCKYTGGVVFHAFLGERLPDIQSAKNFVKTVFENFHLPYLTLTPTFSICPIHGYIAGEHFECPQCVIKQPCEVYSRVVGYLRPVQQWHTGKRQEFKERKEFRIP